MQSGAGSGCKMGRGAGCSVGCRGACEAEQRDWIPSLLSNRAALIGSAFKFFLRISDIEILKIV